MSDEWWAIPVRAIFPPAKPEPPKLCATMTKNIWWTHNFGRQVQVSHRDIEAFLANSSTYFRVQTMCKAKVSSHTASYQRLLSRPIPLSFRLRRKPANIVKPMPTYGNRFTYQMDGDRNEIQPMDRCFTPKYQITPELQECPPPPFKSDVKYFDNTATSCLLPAKVFFPDFWNWMRECHASLDPASRSVSRISPFAACTECGGLSCSLSYDDF